MADMTVYESIRQNIADAKEKILGPAKRARLNASIRKDREEQAKKDLESKADAIERLFNSPDFKVFREFADELKGEMVKSWTRGDTRDYSTSVWLLDELINRPKNVVKLCCDLKESNEG